jgi:predicted transcriptional regulator of viral defense system
MATERIISHVICGKQRARHPDELIAATAAAQHGVIGLRQLVALGLSRRMVEWRLEAGRMHRIHRGVYAVGDGAVSPSGRLMAATLAGGSGAVLSHRSAIVLWGLRAHGGGAVEVTTPRSLSSRSGVCFHQAVLPADELATHEGIPVTGLFRTLLDYATGATPGELERALHEAEVARLTDRLTLATLLARYPGRRGVARIRKAAATLERGARVTRSQLEDRFLRFLSLRDIPQPETNVRVQTAGRSYEVDCLWRHSRVIVELDGRASHDTRRGFHRDRAKLRALAVARWRPLSVTWLDLEDGPDELEIEIRCLLAAPG